VAARVHPAHSVLLEELEGLFAQRHFFTVGDILLEEVFDAFLKLNDKLRPQKLLLRQKG